MSKRDFYETLGLSRGATDEEIKKAYRKLARELHPDRAKGGESTENQFKAVNEAYDVLKDRQKRAAYDQFGHAAFTDGAGAAHARGDFSSAFSDIFDDFFGDIMGGRRAGGGGRTRGSDLRHNLTIDLENAYSGKQVSLKAPGAVTCDACTGTGAEGGAQPTPCPTCAGVGKVRAQQGFFTIERTCPTCSGRGSVINKPCRQCKGAGIVQRERTLNFQVPQGVEDGTRIRLGGEGEPGLRGGPPGDLYVFVSVRPHELFKREGDDLLCEVTVPLAEAMLGGSIEVPMLDGGRTKVAIPAGSSSGKQLRLRGKGMPSLRGARTGDLYLEIHVETPQNLTPRQKELLREFERELSDRQQPETDAFRKKLEKFWQKAT